MGLLNSADKESIKVALPKNANKILDVAVARLYIAYPDPNEWQYTGLSGAIVLVDDLVGNTFFLKLVDIEGHRGVIWDQELYVNFDYQQTRTFFHTFELDECYAGLLFEDLSEAAHFLKRVYKRERYGSKKTLSNKNAIALTNKAHNDDDDDDDIHGPRGETLYGSQRERYNYSSSDSKPTITKKAPPPPPSVPAPATTSSSQEDVSESEDGDWSTEPTPSASAPRTKHSVPPAFIPPAPAPPPSAPAPAPAPPSLSIPQANSTPPAPPAPPAPPSAASMQPQATQPAAQPTRPPEAPRNKNPFPFPIPEPSSPNQVTPFPRKPESGQSPVAFQNVNSSRPVPPPPVRTNRPVPPPPPRTNKVPPPVPPSRRGPAPPPPPHRTTTANGLGTQSTGGYGSRPAPPPPRRGPAPPPPPRSSRFTSFSQQQQPAYSPPPVSFPQQVQPSSQPPPLGPRPQPPIPPTSFNSEPSTVGAGAPPPPPPPPPAMPSATPSGGGAGEATGDVGRDALLASIRGAGGIGSLRKVDKSQLDKPSVLLQESHGETAQPVSSVPTGGGGGGGSLADALASALNQRKNKVAKEDDYDNGDDW